MFKFWKRWFAQAEVANIDLPALPSPPKDALERWQSDYDAWLIRMEEVFEQFPDHAALDGFALTQSEMDCLHSITTAYLQDGREMLEILVLRNESLRRLIAARRAKEG